MVGTCSNIEQAAQLKEIFDLFDTDGGGTIDREEVCSFSFREFAVLNVCHMYIVFILVMMKRKGVLRSILFFKTSLSLQTILQ